MLSARNAILAAIVIFILTILTTILSHLGKPGSDGKGQDTFGVHDIGFRGVYETLEALGIPVERRIAPPKLSDEQATTLALLLPDERRVEIEPTYLQALVPWVKQGGRIVMTLSQWEFFEDMSEDFGLSRSNRGGKVVLSTLGLDDVRIETLEAVLERDEADDSPNHSPHSTATNEDDDGPASIGNALEFFFEPSAGTLEMIPVRAAGMLLNPALPIQNIALWSDEIEVITFGERIPIATLNYTATSGEDFPIAAQFAIGEGSIWIVANAEIFSNEMLATADNSVFAASILAPQGERVIFDEFYHGLGVRGSMLYLLTHPGYFALSLGLLLLVGCWVWRQSIWLGPPLLDATRSRRDIREYVDAMGRFFSTGRKMRSPLIRQLRDGVLRELNVKLSLPPESVDVDRVVAAISRTDPHRAEQVRTCFAEVDGALKSRRRWGKSETVQAMRRLTACL